MSFWLEAKRMPTAMDLVTRSWGRVVELASLLRRATKVMVNPDDPRMDGDAAS